MKIVCGALVVLLLMIMTPSAFGYMRPQLYTAPTAKNQTSDFLSGLEHGKADTEAGCHYADGCHWWILERGNGFINQTQDFIRGYVLGFCSDVNQLGDGGSDAEQADITCIQGPEGVRWALPGSLDDNNTTFWNPNRVSEK